MTRHVRLRQSLRWATGRRWREKFMFAGVLGEVETGNCRIVQHLGVSTSLTAKESALYRQTCASVCACRHTRVKGRRSLSTPRGIPQRKDIKHCDLIFKVSLSKTSRVQSPSFWWQWGRLCTVLGREPLLLCAFTEFVSRSCWIQSELFDQMYLHINFLLNSYQFLSQFWVNFYCYKF